jgi:hypothetical protein
MNIECSHLYMAQLVLEQTILTLSCPEDQNYIRRL